VGQRHCPLEKMGLNMQRQYVNPTPAFWQGKRVVLTGHTGFKGSWLGLWLQSMGAVVRGISLDPPTKPALFAVAQVAQGMDHQVADIRDPAATQTLLAGFQPEIVIHMAAQPLVRLSYQPAHLRRMQPTSWEPCMCWRPRAMLAACACNR